MERYPLAVDGNPATTYGPLPDRGMDPVALVYHTTETRGVPGYQGGDTAPHYTFEPAADRWWRHADLSRRVGTMKGSSTTGTYANEKAIQLEIVAYSDRSLAGSGGLWVGDFTAAHYRELAAFFSWCQATNHHVANEVTPTPPGGWLYGSGSPHRLSVADWYGFGGLTCHGAVPGQTHWDTGVLDLERIANEAGGTAMDLERYATRWRNPLDFDAAAARGIITEDEATYWKGVPTDSGEWQDLRDAVEVRAPLWPA